MWIMTKYGFFSIVRARSNRVSDRIQVRPHPNLMMIRARNRDHLEALRAAFTLSGDIVATKNTDYPYRVIVSREVVGQIMIDLTLDVVYTNFKDEVHRARPDDEPFHAFLTSVWHLGLHLTPGHRQPATSDGVFLVDESAEDVEEDPQCDAEAFYDQMFGARERPVLDKDHGFM